MKMMNKKVYLSCQGAQSLISPVRVGAVVFRNEIKGTKKQKLRKKLIKEGKPKDLRLISLEEQEEILSVLEEDEDYKLYSYTLTIEDEVKYGLARLCSKYGYYLVSRMQFDQRKEELRVVLGNKDTYGSLNDRLYSPSFLSSTEEIERQYTNLRVWYQYCWWVVHQLDTLCPFYNWKENYGLPTGNHLRLCLYWGIHPEFYRVYEYKHYRLLYRYWQKLKQTGCGWANQLDLNNDPPIWWSPPEYIKRKLC